MNNKLLKKLAIIAGSTLAVLTIVLVVHIYMVTRPKAPDATTIAMARIDIKDDISEADANEITSWMYQQKGVEHVLCNPETNIIVFTFFPAKVKADDLAQQFKSNFKLNAVRFLPSEAEMRKGCPVAVNSFSSKTISFIKRIF